MLKKIFSCIKSKCGNSIDAIIITPIWLMILIFISCQMQIKESRQSVTDSAQIASKYIMTSESLSDGINLINTYLQQRSDNRYYDSFSIENIIGISYKPGTNNNQAYTYTSNPGDFTTDDVWKNGSIVEFYLTRKTPYSGSSALRFCAFKNDEFCFKIVNDLVVTKGIVILTLE